MQCLWRFVSAPSSPLQQLVADEPDTKEERELLNCTPESVHAAIDAALPTIFHRFALNDSQKRAIEQAPRHHLLLVEGPPGTGKTQTSIALLALHAAAHIHPMVAAAPSNEGADVLARRADQHRLSVGRYGQKVAPDLRHLSTKEAAAEAEGNAVNQKAEQRRRTF